MGRPAYWEQAILGQSVRIGSYTSQHYLLKKAADSGFQVLKSIELEKGNIFKLLYKSFFYLIHNQPASSKT